MKISLIDAHRIAAVHSGRCLSQNIKTNKLRWQCKYGHRFTLTIGQILDHEKWCPICAIYESDLQNRAKHPKSTAISFGSALAVLYKEYPLIFPTNQFAAVPLKIGIHLDIYKDLALKYPELSQEKIRQAIAYWCKQETYLAASACLNMPRYDMYGNIAGLVTAKEVAALEKARNSSKPLKIYTDGSSTNHTCTWSFVVYNAKDEELYYENGCFKESSSASCLIAELHASIMAIHWLDKSEYQTATIYHDNLMVGFVTPGKKKGLPKAVKKYNACIKPFVDNGIITFQKVKSHTKIWGNERADGLCTLAYDYYQPKGIIARKGTSSNKKPTLYHHLQKVCHRTRSIYRYYIKRRFERKFNAFLYKLGLKLIELAKRKKAK